MIEVTVKINGELKERIHITNTGRILFGQQVYSVTALERMPCPHIIHNTANGVWGLIMQTLQHFFMADNRK